MAFIHRVASTASQDRLEKRIEERLRPEADQARVGKGMKFSRIEVVPPGAASAYRLEYP